MPDVGLHSAIHCFKIFVEAIGLGTEPKMILTLILLYSISLVKFVQCFLGVYLQMFEKYSRVILKSTYIVTNAIQKMKEVIVEMINSSSSCFPTILHQNEIN